MQGSSLSLWMNLGGRVLVFANMARASVLPTSYAHVQDACAMYHLFCRDRFSSCVMPETRSVASGGHDGRRVWASHAQPEAHQDIIFPHATTFTKVRQYQ